MRAVTPWLTSPKVAATWWYRRVRARRSDWIRTWLCCTSPWTASICRPPLPWIFSARWTAWGMSACPGRMPPAGISTRRSRRWRMEACSTPANTVPRTTNGFIPRGATWQSSPPWSTIRRRSRNSWKIWASPCWWSAPAMKTTRWEEWNGWSSMVSCWEKKNWPRSCSIRRWMLWRRWWDRRTPVRRSRFFTLPPPALSTCANPVIMW